MVQYRPSYFFVFLGFLLWLVFIAGCASQTKPVSASMPTIVAADAAKITFFRLTGPPAAVKGTLALDGQEIGKVFVRRFAVIYVNPGRHTFDFSFPFWASSAAHSVSLECEPSKEYFICHGSSMSFGGFIPVGPIVIYSITSGMNVVSKEVAAPYLNKFDLAFTYGTKEPNQLPRATGQRKK